MKGFKGKAFYRVKLVSNLPDYIHGTTLKNCRLILVSSKDKLGLRIITLGHERLHELLEYSKLAKFSRSKVDGLLDLIDYLAIDCRNTFNSDLYYSKGFKGLVTKVINRYIIEDEEE